MVPPYCSVLSCGQQYHRGVRRFFYTLPKVVSHKGRDVLRLSHQRRYDWIAAISQNSFYPLNKGAYYVCSDHFHCGTCMITALTDPLFIDSNFNIFY